MPSWAARGPSQKPRTRWGTECPHNPGGVWPCRPSGFKCFGFWTLRQYISLVSSPRHVALGSEQPRGGTLRLLPLSLPAPASCSQLGTLPELWVPPQPVPPSQRRWSSNQVPNPLHLQLAPSPAAGGSALAAPLPRPSSPPPTRLDRALSSRPVSRRHLERKQMRVAFSSPCSLVGHRDPASVLPLLSPQQVLAGILVAAPPSLPHLAERPARSALPFPAGLLRFPSCRPQCWVRSF